MKRSFKTRIKLLLVSSVMVISGCATKPPFGCQIPDSCSPINKNYTYARADETPDGWSTKESNGKTDSDIQAPERESIGFFKRIFGKNKTDAALIDTDLNESPVYMPPEPFRIWIAHWNSSDGVFFAGHYAYIKTDDYYIYRGEIYPAYRTEDKTSVGGFNPAMLSPVRPDQLGFKAGKRKVADTGIAEGLVLPK